MIRTSSVNGSPEMKDEGMAMAIEMIVEHHKEQRHYSIEFDAVRDPEDDGSVQVENLFVATWPTEGDEPKWKKIIRKIFKLP